MIVLNPEWYPAWRIVQRLSTVAQPVWLGVQNALVSGAILPNTNVQLTYLAGDGSFICACDPCGDACVCLCWNCVATREEACKKANHGLACSVLCPCVCEGHHVRQCRIRRLPSCTRRERSRHSRNSEPHQATQKRRRQSGPRSLLSGRLPGQGAGEKAYEAERSLRSAGDALLRRGSGSQLGQERCELGVCSARGT
jgi:hypothetical protein